MEEEMNPLVEESLHESIEYIEEDIDKLRDFIKGNIERTNDLAELSRTAFDIHTVNIEEISAWISALTAVVVEYGNLLSEAGIERSKVQQCVKRAIESIPPDMKKSAAPLIDLISNNIDDE
jgi:hypothetical protein